MAIDDRTAHLSLPLPNSANTLLDDVARLRDALTGVDTAINGKQAALGFTAENAASKGAVNGYAGLDSGGKVPAAQLPSFVDDVLEVANSAALPVTGETGKIYVTLDTNKTYRWGGSAYAEISASPGSTDAVTEGATNKYFTDARARAAQVPATSLVLGLVKVGSGLTVDGSGVLAVTGGGGGGSGLPAFDEVIIVPASNGQTTLTPSGGYTAGQIEVYLNGVLLYGNGDDYTASTGTTIVLTVGANTTDTILVRRWAYIPIANAVNKTGDTMTGALSVPAGAIGAQAPQVQEVVKKAGDTLSGNLAYTRIDKGTVSTGTVTFAVMSAFEQRLQVGGAVTVAFSTWAASGSDCGVKIKMVNWGLASVTFPTINWQLPAGGYTTSFSTYLAAIGRAALQSSGTDFGVFWSDDAGTTVYGKLL